MVEWSRDGFPPWGKFILLIEFLLPLTLFTPRRVPPHLCVFGLVGLVAFLAWEVWLRWPRAESVATALR